MNPNKVGAYCNTPLRPNKTLLISIDGDLYRRLRRIGQNEQQSAEAIAADMLEYQLRQQEHRARPQAGPISALLLEDDEEEAERESRLVLGL